MFSICNLFKNLDFDMIQKVKQSAKGSG